jgi:hypothetical protein
MLFRLILGLIVTAIVLLAINEFVLETPVVATQDTARLVYFAVLFVVFGALMVSRYRSQWRLAPLHLAIWLAIVVVLLVIYRLFEL